jgi:hypothetical protein
MWNVSSMIPTAGQPTMRTISTAWRGMLRKSVSSRGTGSIATTASRSGAYAPAARSPSATQATRRQRRFADRRRRPANTSGEP